MYIAGYNADRKISPLFSVCSKSLSLDFTETKTYTKFSISKKKPLLSVYFSNLVIY